MGSSYYIDPSFGYPFLLRHRADASRSSTESQLKVLTAQGPVSALGKPEAGLDTLHVLSLCRRYFGSVLFYIAGSDSGEAEGYVTMD